MTFNFIDQTEPTFKHGQTRSEEYRRIQSYD